MRSEARDGTFTLTLTLTRAVWPAMEPIDGEAALSVQQGAVDIGGSGAGLIGFRYSQVGGRIVVDPIWTADCARHQVTAAAPMRSVLTKSGGWSQDEPDAAFFEAFFEGDGVRLPPGVWDITAIASGGCGEPVSVRLETSARILVTP